MRGTSARRAEGGRRSTLRERLVPDSVKGLRSIQRRSIRKRPVAVVKCRETSGLEGFGSKSRRQAAGQEKWTTWNDVRRCGPLALMESNRSLLLLLPGVAGGFPD